MVDVFNQIATLIQPSKKDYDNLMPISAIWLKHPILKGNGHISPRICKGDHVMIKDGCIVDCIGHATHTVSECLGTFDSSVLYMILKDITTGEELTIFIGK